MIKHRVLEYIYVVEHIPVIEHILVKEYVMLVSQKPEKPKKKPEPESSGPSQVGFHLIKFQVSRAMPKRNPKIRVGSGFGILQVFVHSTVYIIQRPSGRIS